MRRLKARLAEAYGNRLAGVVLYGSYARGEAGPDSDVDVLVLLHGSVDRWAEMETLAGLAVEVEAGSGEMLAPLVRSASDLAQARSPFLATVRAEGVEA